MSPLEHDAAFVVPEIFLELANAVAAKLHERAKMNLQSIGLRLFHDLSFGSDRLRNHLSSYLLASLILFARPPEQLEFSKHWVSELGCGQGQTIQHGLPSQQLLFDVAWGS